MGEQARVGRFVIFFRLLKSSHLKVNRGLIRETGLCNAERIYTRYGYLAADPPTVPQSFVRQRRSPTLDAVNHRRVD